MTDRQTLAILGAGYAGLFAARRAARAIPAAARDSVRIVLVDREAQWVERTRWHQLAAGENVAERRLSALFRGTGVEVVTASVTTIDLEARTIFFDDSTPPLDFDRLVYTLGSSSSAEKAAGATEHPHTHVHTLDTPRSSRSVSHALAGRPHGRVTVVGGGLTGIQTVTQIAERFPQTRPTLLTSGDVAHELPPPAQDYVRRALDQRGVELLQGRANTIDETGCVVSNEVVPADLVVWVAGFSPSPLAGSSGLEVTEQGQVVVDETLRSASHPFVFAAGDAAAVTRAASSFGAYAATATGAVAGRNAAWDLIAEKPAPLDLGYAFLGVSLGRHDAVLQVLAPDGTPRDRMLTGRLAHALKEGVEHYVSGMLRAERIIPGLYHWAPAGH